MIVISFNSYREWSPGQCCVHLCTSIKATISGQDVLLPKIILHFLQEL